MLNKTSDRKSQVDRLQRLMRTDLVKGFSLAIDGGANVGAWSIVMAQHFKKVLAFEPTPEAFSLLEANAEAWPNVECHNLALMNKAGSINMEKPEYNIKHQRATGEKINHSLRSRYAEWNSEGDIQAVTIDSLKVPSCDLIKLDLEGAEPLALDGAAETIAKFKPVLIVEIKRHSKRFGVHPKYVHQKVLDMGYRESHRDGRDRFYVSIE